MKSGNFIVVSVKSISVVKVINIIFQSCQNILLKSFGEEPAETICSARNSCGIFRESILENT